MGEQYQNIHQKIIDQCKIGDRDAQFQLYKLYYRSMYNTSLRMVGNAVDAEDIMQEAFLNAFNKLDTYQGNVSFGAWLKKIVVNRSLDYLKKRKVYFEEINERVLDEKEDSIADLNEIDLSKLKQAVMKLPEGYRVVLSLYLLEGYDHDEISEILQITNVSSRTQLLRAKKKLREILITDGLFSFN